MFKANLNDFLNETGHMGIDNRSQRLDMNSCLATATLEFEQDLCEIQSNREN